MNSSSSALRFTALGAAWGAVAGLGSGALDVASTLLWLSSARDQRRLVGVVMLLAVGATAIVGAIVGAVLGAAFSERRWRAAWLRSLALCCVPGSIVGWLLFTGGTMRRVPALWLWRPLAMLLVTCALATTSLVLAASAAALQRSSLVCRATGASALVVVAMIAHALDHRLFPRLYEYLHTILGALTSASLAAALAVLWPAPSPRVASALTLAAAPALLLGLALLERWDNVRAEVFGTHAPYVRHVARSSAWFVHRSPSDHATVAAIDRERLERDRQAVEREADPTLPRAAGAHVLLITVDAMRADRLDARRTPRMWARMARGVRFTRAYAQAPHSSYSITSLHTSEYLHETVQLGQRQPLPTLASTLGAAGYRTVAIYTEGIFFTEGERLVDYRDRRLDFSRSEHRSLDARATTDVAISELEESVRRGEPPTFLWAHYFDAHEPYRGEGATPIDRYDAAITAVDSEVDRLLRFASSRLRRPIVALLTADHGEEFGEHGGVYHGSALNDEQARVPLALLAPALDPAVIERPVALLDVAPTVLALAGVARPATMRGRDLRPLMVGRDVPAEPVFASVNTRTMVVRWPYKLVADLRWGVRELYDLASDPGERRNLADVEPARVRALEAEIHRWIASLGGAAADEARARMGDRSVVARLSRRALDPSVGEAERVAAIDALATLRDPAIARSLAVLLEAPSPKLRWASAVSAGLAGLDDSRVRSTLLEFVGCDDPSLRSRSALALGRLGDPRSTVALIELLRSGDEAERSSSVEALARISLASEGARESGALVAPLLEALEDDHLRYRAVLALGAAGGARVLDVLARVAREDRADDVRAWAVAGLALTSAREATALVIERLERDASAQRFAASALARLAPVERGGVAWWDARDGRGGPWLECAIVDHDSPWVELATRACRAHGRATIELDGRAAGRVTVWLRARGTGTLVVRSSRRELLRFVLEESMREWRAPIDLGAVMERNVRSDPWVLETEGDFWLGHVVVLSTVGEQ